MVEWINCKVVADRWLSGWLDARKDRQMGGRKARRMSGRVEMDERVGE